MEIALVGALVAGILTLLSPCSVMLLPAFFSYAFSSPSQLLSRAGVFYLGLITTLVPMGILAGSFGAYVTEHRYALVTISSWVVIALGASMIVGVSIPSLSATTVGDVTSAMSVWALGTVYGLAGVCAGPLLGAVLTLAALGSNAAYGGLVLLVFAAGMIVPLLILATLWSRLPFVRTVVRPRIIRIGRWSNTWTSIASGAVMIAIGVLLLRTDGTASLTGVLGTEQQFKVENWALRNTGEISDVAVAVAASATLVIARQVRRRHATRSLERRGEKSGGERAGSAASAGLLSSSGERSRP